MVADRAVNCHAYSGSRAHIDKAFRPSRLGSQHGDASRRRAPMKPGVAPSANKPVERAHPSGSEPSPKPRPIVRAGNVEFECLERSDLAQVPVVVQALDNQWLPRKLTPAAFKRGIVDTHIDKKLRQAVRSEYLRSLINSEQLVLNRAYLYNNPAVSQDYAQGSRDGRESFKA